jgi:hypothetical protein
MKQPTPPVIQPNAVADLADSSDVKKFSQKADINITTTSNGLLLTHSFRLNRFNIGVLLFLILSGACFFLAVTLREDPFEFWFFLTMGILILAAFGFVVANILFNFLLITDEEIIFRHKLSKRKIKLHRDLKVKTKIKKLKSRTRYGTHRSVDVDILVKDKGEKIYVFGFLMEGSDRKEAEIIGETIVQYIKQKIKMRETVSF